MIQFKVRFDSIVPPSTQLFNQIRFVIASNQYLPGERLPSIRQLAKTTGLHRNTINKIYQQLEEIGLVESIVGSGIYVKSRPVEHNLFLSNHPQFIQYSSAIASINKNVDGMLWQGLTFSEIQKLFLEIFNWRSLCSTQIIVTVPDQDIGAGKLILQELKNALDIPIQLVPLKKLSQTLSKKSSVTVVTSRYFVLEVETITSTYGTRLLPVDVYDYNKEIEIIKVLPKDTRLGIVSLSTGVIKVAEILIHSLRGNDLLLISTQANNQNKLLNLVKSAQTIISDVTSYSVVKQAISFVRDDLICPPNLICSECYLKKDSINFLKRELGLK